MSHFSVPLRVKEEMNIGLFVTTVDMPGQNILDMKALITIYFKCNT